MRRFLGRIVQNKWNQPNPSAMGRCQIGFLEQSLMSQQIIVKILTEPKSLLESARKLVAWFPPLPKKNLTTFSKKAQ